MARFAQAPTAQIEVSLTVAQTGIGAEDAKKLPLLAEQRLDHHDLVDARFPAAIGFADPGAAKGLHVLEVGPLSDLGPARGKGWPVCHRMPLGIEDHQAVEQGHQRTLLAQSHLQLGVVDIDLARQEAKDPLALDQLPRELVRHQLRLILQVHQVLLARQGAAAQVAVAEQRHHQHQPAKADADEQSKAQGKVQPAGQGASRAGSRSDGTVCLRVDMGVSTLASRRGALIARGGRAHRQGSSPRASSPSRERMVSSRPDTLTSPWRWKRPITRLTVSSARPRWLPISARDMASWKR